MESSIDRPRQNNGRFAAMQCPNNNCGGVLRPDRDDWWRCDGLIYEEINGPLYPCPTVFHPDHAPLLK